MKTLKKAWTWTQTRAIGFSFKVKGFWVTVYLTRMGVFVWSGIAVYLVTR